MSLAIVAAQSNVGPVKQALNKTCIELSARNASKFNKHVLNCNVGGVEIQAKRLHFTPCTHRNINAWPRIRVHGRNCDAFQWHV